MFNFLAKLSPIYKYTISGHSMEPTLRAGESILTSSLPYLFSNPKKYDIIAFRDPASKKVFIKRIIEAKNDHYKVLGDNTQDSLDSRSFGWIGKKDIIGKVIFAKIKD